MEKSPTIGELAKALATFATKMKTVSFDSNNPFFKSKYASLTALVENARVELSSCGLAVSQLTEGEGSVTTILMHTSGEWISSNLKLTPAKNDPQGLGSAITYSRRYAYASILGLVADNDDDGNEATGLNGNGKHKKEEPLPIISAPVLTLKDRVIGTAKTKFKNEDEFKAWRVDNNLIEDISKATESDFNQILVVMREYKGINRLSNK